MDLIDHLCHDHILFAGCGSPDFLVLIYLVEKLQEVGAWRGVSQVSLIDMWEACYRVASGSLERGGACWHKDRGQGRDALLSGGAPGTCRSWGGVGLFAFPFVSMTRTKRRDRGIHMVFV